VQALIDAQWTNLDALIEQLYRMDALGLLSCGHVALGPLPQSCDWCRLRQLRRTLTAAWPPR
jgi:hypothetical protein